MKCKPSLDVFNSSVDISVNKFKHAMYTKKNLKDNVYKTKSSLNINYFSLLTLTICLLCSNHSSHFIEEKNSLLNIDDPVA